MLNNTTGTSSPLSMTIIGADSVGYTLHLTKTLSAFHTVTDNLGFTDNAPLKDLLRSHIAGAADAQATQHKFCNQALALCQLFLANLLIIHLRSSWFVLYRILK